MDKRILIGIIGEKLEIIQEQFDIIKAYEGKIPVIEIDLLMSNIRDLYELFINLQQENMGSRKATPSRPPAILGFEPVSEKQQEPSPVPPAPEPEKEQEIPVASEKPELETMPGPEPESVIPPEPEPEIEPEPETPVHAEPEPWPEPETAVHDEPEPEPLPSPPPGPVHQEAPKPVPHPEPEIHHHQEIQDTKPPKTAFDLFSEGTPGTLADRYKESQEKRVADRLQENKVVDLRTTIGINDKFLFINELFDGNMRIYDEGVNKLNECQTLAQADLLLLDLKIVYNWDSENPTVKKFVDLVRRKF